MNGAERAAFVPALREAKVLLALLAKERTRGFTSPDSCRARRRVAYGPLSE